MIVEHFNHHNHGVPHLNLPDAYSLAKFNKICSDNPTKEPLKLVAGSTTNDLSCNTSVINIYQAFSNEDRVSHYRRKALKSSGICFENTLESIFEFQENFGNIVVSSTICY